MIIVFNTHNIVNGQWKQTKFWTNIVDPWNGEKFIEVPDTREEELEPFLKSLNSCSKSGLHK